MAEWKKVVVSGSSAELSNLNVDSAVTASAFKGDGSALTNISIGALDGNVSASSQVFQDVSGDVTIASNGAAAIGSGVIVNDDINGSAAIAHGKLDLDGSTIISGSASDVRTFLSVESGADVTDTANVTAAGALMDSELTDLAGVKGVTISTLQPKPSEGAFADGDKTKLDAIEASADVTDTANVTAAGALMDSELTDLAGVKGVTISTLQSKPSEGAFANGDKTKLDGIEASADVTDSTNVLSALSNQDVNLGTGDLTAVSASLNSIALDVNGTDTLLLRDGGSNSVNIHAKSSVNFTSDMDSAALFKFGTGASATTIDVENGQVGIGTTPSAGALDVKGQVSASSFIGNGSGLTGIVASNTVSGSGQVVLESADKTGFTGASSITTLGTVTSGNVKAILPAGTISASAQLANDFLDTLGEGVHSGSAQVVSSLSNQDVNLGTGDLIATDVQFTNLKLIGGNGNPATIITSSEAGASLSIGDHGNTDHITRIKLRVYNNDIITIDDQEVTIDGGGNGVNVTGHVSASRFKGSGADLTSIPNSALSNSSVSLGGVTVALGASDATPAFNLADATGYLTSNLSGTITNAQLGGSISNDKLAGSIANDKLSNSAITIAGAATSLGGSITQAAILAGSGVISGSGGTAASATSASFASSAAEAQSVAANSVALGTDTTGAFVSALGSGTGVTIGSNSGEASSPTIAVNYGSTANTAVQGNATATFTGTANEITVSNSGAQAIGGNIAVTIGLPDDVTIAGTGSVNGDLSVAGNLAVGGDLTYVNSTDLVVQDPFILLNSGSNGATQGDSGIIFGGADGTINSGNLLFWDKSYNGNDGRLAIKSEFAHTTTGNPTPDYTIAGVFEGTAANAATAQADHVGNIRVESEEIYIYV